MKIQVKTFIKATFALVFCAMMSVFSGANVFADGYALTVSPMSQTIILDPGETYEGSFKISNPISSTLDTYYEIAVEPFYRDEKDETVFEAEGDMGEIANWISFSVPTSGKLAPNEVKDVIFKIQVPKNAPSGGQYAAISTSSSSKNPEEKEDDKKSSNQTTINEIRRVAHLIYAEVTGNTVKKGEITDANVPGFMLSGDIIGSSVVKNEGNVHGTASYTLQVFPLFSNEEIYTNEEEPETHTVLPDRTHYNETVWNETPAIGIFKVIYKVEFEGSEAKVEKMVIKCPIWLLFVVLFAIIAIIIFFVVRAKSRKKAQA